MGSRLLVFGALGLACLLAAGGGAYLAVRSANGPQPPGVIQPVTAGGQAAGGAQGAPASLVTTPPASSETPAAPPAARPVSQAGTPDSRPSNDREPRAARRRQAEQPAPASTAQEDAAGPPVQVDPVPSVAAPVQAQPVTQPPAETARELVELTVPAESVLGLQVQTAVSSETARVEDRVDARVTRDVRVEDRIAIPAGSRVEGSVVQVERGGKLKDRAHFAIRFHTVVLPDGTRTPLTAEALYREGPSPTNKSAAKIGGAAVGGAILGAILGGGKGAAIGGSVGAAGGTAATMAGQREPALLAAGSIVNVRLMSPVTVTVER